MIRVAAAGAGYFSQFHYDAWRRIEGVRIVGVCDQNLERAEGAAGLCEANAFADFSTMLEATAPDLVDIITPPSTHLEYVSLALRHGADVICQKPFCASLEEARELVQQAARLGRKIVVHENFRFQPWYREIRVLLQADRLGQVHQVRFALRPGDGQGPDAYLARQPYFQTMPRLLIHETGVHWIDTFRFLLGEPDWVFSDLRRLNPVISGEDAGLVLFGYADGRRALFDGNRLSDHAARNRRLTLGEMTIEGTAGTLTLTGDGEILIRDFGSNQQNSHTYAWRDQGFGGDCVHALQQHVIDYLTKGSPLENEASNYLDVITTEQAIYESAEAGLPVRLSH